MMMQDITKNQTSERNEKQRKTAREIIEQYDGPPVRIMEVCGTHTHEIFRLGIRKLLPKQVELISGPGCPVCVTPVGFIDEAVWLALQAGVTVCTFWRSCPCTGNKDESCGSERKGRKDPDCLFTGRCRKNMRGYIRRNKSCSCPLVLRQQHLLLAYQ